MKAGRKWTAVLAVGALALGGGPGCGLRMFSPVDARKVAPDTWAYLDGGGNSLVIAHGRESFAVDVKLGEAAQRQRSLADEALGRKVRRILLTHSHLEHWGGLELYPDAGAVLAHPKTRERIARWLRERRRPNPYTWIAVEREVRLALVTGREGEKGEEVWIRWLGVGHTDGDLVAFVPGQRLVATGDLFAAGYEPSADAESGGRLLELRQALDRLLGYPFERVVPGHGPLAVRADVVAAREYLVAMEAAVQDAVRRGLSEEAAVEAGESALQRFPRLEPLPFRSDRRGNLRTLYREVQQTAKSAAP